MGELSNSQKRGILSLLYKKNDKSKLANWRPISLLNTDYKILAHVLANRLKKVINKLIHTDQTGYLKGRSIGQNIRLIQDVIDYFENDNTQGAIIFLDFRKAFDTVNHNFLMRVLEKLNFGQSFIQWVKTIYNKAESCVSNNGWTSKPLQIQKGIRQGCPLSALLFLLVAEVLATNIRKDTTDALQINLKNENKYIHVSQLADDTTLFLKNENAVTDCLRKVEKFGNVSGLKLNKDKTEGLWLGGGSNRHDGFAGINWDKNCIKTLGVYFGYDKKETEIKNWSSKIESIKSTLNQWSRRDLTLQGRILILKTMALAKVVYLVSSISIPSWAVNEINKEFFQFVWRNKRDKIARKVMINEIERGGLNMLDFRSFCLSMKAVWAVKLNKSDGEGWSIIPKKYFENCGIEVLMCMNSETEKQLPIKLPQFYKEVIHAWHLCGGGNKAPQNATEIRQEIIWGNKHIQCKGKTLFFPNWHECNLNFVDDLLNEKGHFKSGEEIFSQLKNKTNWLMEYKIILKCIPRLWKEKIQDCNMNIKINKSFKPFLSIKNQQIFKLSTKSKEYYQYLINKIKHMTYNEKYWTTIFPERPFWTDLWNSRVKNQKNKKIADFHFKLLHRILPCQENLFRWKILNSNKCRFGCQCIENYHHMFVVCPRLNHLYNKVEAIFKSMNLDIHITYKTLILGYKATYPAYEDINTLLSHIFFAVYRFWIQNDSSIDINIWVFSELKKWQNIYENTKHAYEIISGFLSKW